eukprot:gene2946-1193_t
MAEVQCVLSAKVIKQVGKAQSVQFVITQMGDSTDPKDVDLPERATSTYLVDLMALVRTMPSFFDTYHDLAMSLFDMLPVGYNRIDIVVDTYRGISSKDPEHEKHCIADRVIITTSDFFVAEQLSSNQEEADTKLLLQAVHSLSENADASVVVRSSLSGDVDIFLSVFLESPEKEMTFARQVLLKNNRCLHVFSRLGAEWSIDDDLLSKLEEDICNIFGKKKKDVNAVRYEISKNVYENKGKIQDSSLLPPWRQLLHLHCQRSNYITKVWRSGLQTNIDFADIGQNGWSADGKIVWIDAAFPEEVEQILAGEESNNESSDKSEDEWLHLWHLWDFTTHGACSLCCDCPVLRLHDESAFVARSKGT